MSARTKSYEPLDPESAITRPDHVIGKESPDFNELQLVLIEKIKQLLLDML